MKKFQKKISKTLCLKLICHRSVISMIIISFLLIWWWSSPIISFDNYFLLKQNKKIKLNLKAKKKFTFQFRSKKNAGPLHTLLQHVSSNVFSFIHSLSLIIIIIITRNFHHPSNTNKKKWTVVVDIDGWLIDRSIGSFVFSLNVLAAAAVWKITFEIDLKNCACFRFVIL